MPVKQRKPTSPGRRFVISQTYTEITKKEPEKSLTEPLKKSGGRNNKGRITSRFRGGGQKRLYRVIDFKRDKTGVAGKVMAIEYDPNRTCRIALVQYDDGEKRYILAPVGLAVDSPIHAGEDADIKPGNALPLRSIPLGTVVHNVELYPGRGGQIVRSAGLGAQVMAKEGAYVTLRLPSGEMRRIHHSCKASVGQVGNIEHESESLGKAGRRRAKGFKPHVRGVVMSPRDHPHGGGEAKSPVGRKKGPASPWGQVAQGLKTRRNKRSAKFIVRPRGGK